MISRPMVVLAGGYDQDQGGMGAFQEWPQVTMQTSLSVCVCVCVCVCVFHLLVTRDGYDRNSVFC